MIPGSVELRIRDRAWRSRLDPAAIVEVWRGADCLGELPAALVALLLEHHLGAARLQEAVSRATEDLMHQRKPTVPMAEQAARRARRRRRALLLLGALLCGGCLSTVRSVQVEKVDLRELARDRQVCEWEAAKAAGCGAICMLDPKPAYRLCMSRLGYTVDGVKP